MPTAGPPNGDQKGRPLPLPSMPMKDKTGGTPIQSGDLNIPTAKMPNRMTGGRTMEPSKR